MTYPRCRAARLLPLILLALPLCARAQPRSLTLEQALQLADEQSLDIRKARMALDRSAIAIRAAHGLYLPEVSAGADYAFSIQRGVFFVAPGTPFNETGVTQAFPIGSRQSATLTLNITQPLYDPIRRMQQTVAEAGVEVSRAQLEVARALVRMNVEKAFYRAVYMQSERGAREQQVKTAMANFDVAQARWKGGRAMALDTLTAGVTVARARADAERANYDYLGSLLLLARTLNIPDYQNLNVVGSLDIPTSPGPSGGDLTASIGRLNSAQLKLAQAERAAAQTNVGLETYRAYPTLDAVGRVQGLGQSNSVLPDDAKFAMTSQIGLSALYPISNLWRGNPKQEDAELRVQEADLEIARIHQNDSVQLESILLQMRGAKAQIVAEEASLDQARKAVEITMILYKEGRAGIIDVENAQSRVLDAQMTGDRLRLQFLEAYAELKAVVGDF
ncbi:MAG: outer rane efflux protein [Chlorobi bacterium]|nr:outer rane efflux protein [Chlorobiota bacterium]